MYQVVFELKCHFYGPTMMPGEDLRVATFSSAETSLKVLCFSKIFRIHSKYFPSSIILRFFGFRSLCCGVTTVDKVVHQS